MIRALRPILFLCLIAITFTFSQPAKAAELLTNGGFETAGLAGWTAVNGTSPWIVWQRAATGFNNGFLAPAAAQSGSFVAYQGVTGDPATRTLVQQITIPAASTASFTWRHRFQFDNTSFCDGAACGTVTYAVEVLNTSNIVLETLTVLVAGPDTFVDTGWRLFNRSLTAYAGQTIRIRFRTTNTANLSGPGQLEIDTASVQSPSVLPPTAASVMISGRVSTNDGNGISNAVVSLVDQSGAIKVTRTNPFGYFQFDGVESGRVYFLNATSKRYTFQPMVVSVADEVSGLEIVAEDSSEPEISGKTDGDPGF